MSRAFAYAADYLSRSAMAEAVRFELTVGCPTAVFKSDFRDSLQYLAIHYDNKFNNLPMQVFCARSPNVAGI